MRKLITNLLLFLSLGVIAQDLQALNDDIVLSTTSNDVISRDYPKPIVLINTSFEEAADNNNIPYRTFSELENVENGYYIITGVFGKAKNGNKSIKKLKRKGFEEAGLIFNPENNLNYVYLAYYPFGLEAVDACVSNQEGSYTDEVWILEVENSMTIGGSQMAVIEVNDIEPTTTSQMNDENEELFNTVDTTSERPIITDATSKSKTIEKADAYFNKMWYAEAADLYEQALAKGANNYTRDNIQKAADAHYYNTDMEQAYQWYDLLYENYGDDMSEDNLFKYAHTLKGTGKYGRAKRLMRKYNRKEGEDFAEADDSAIETQNEMTLDSIINSEQNFIIKNLSVNTKYSDFSPMFLDSTKIVFSSAKDSSFFTTRKYKWNNQPYLDLYVADINKESQDLESATKLSKKINSKYHEASVAFSPDNTTMYFTRNNYGKRLKRDSEGVNNLKIYKSNKVGEEWAEAVEVSFNSDDYSTGHPALSPDGKQLYFVSDMPGSIGKSDIFVVDILDDGSFSSPRNLGPGINTNRREMFPFFNGKKLYFSSDGHTGLGGLDVFEAAYDAEEGFGDVVNMGKPINSNKDDFSYIVNENNAKGFFASNRDGGKGDDDIYSFKRPEIEKIPVNNNAIAGVVSELTTGDFMSQTMVQLFDENGVQLNEMLTDDEGSFRFEDLESNTKYTVKTTQSKFFENEKAVATEDNEIINVDISMKRLEDMIAVEEGIKKLKTETIYFEFDKSEVRPDAAKELNKLVSVMNEYPDMAIKIESHTDSRGSKAYNEYLSDKRAKSTRDYIISQGIDASRIESAIGYGESRLLNECDGTVACSEATHLLNRRSEFIIVRE